MNFRSVKSNVSGVEYQDIYKRKHKESYVLVARFLQCLLLFTVHTNSSLHIVTSSFNKLTRSPSTSLAPVRTLF